MVYNRTDTVHIRYSDDFRPLADYYIPATDYMTVWFHFLYWWKSNPEVSANDIVLDFNDPQCRYLERPLYTVEKLRKLAASEKARREKADAFRQQCAISSTEKAVLSINKYSYETETVERFPVEAWAVYIGNEPTGLYAVNTYYDCYAVYTANGEMLPTHYTPLGLKQAVSLCVVVHGWEGTEDLSEAFNFWQHNVRGTE